VSILALSREYPIVAPAEKGPLWHSTNFKLPSRRNEPHAQLISRLKSLLCNFLPDTSTRTPIHTPMATMSWQINCVFPFYFDAGFSRHLFLCAIFVAGVEWSYKLATFAVAICRFMRFSCGCRKAGNPEGRRDHLPKSSCLVSSWHLHHLRMRMRICYLSVCVCACGDFRFRPRRFSIPPRWFVAPSAFSGLPINLSLPVAHSPLSFCLAFSARRECVGAQREIARCFIEGHTF